MERHQAARGTDTGKDGGEMKHSKPTSGHWVAVMGMVDTDNDDVPDVCTCDPLSFDQGHLKYDFNTVLANAALCAQAKPMLALLKRCEKVLDDQFGIYGFDRHQTSELLDDIEKVIARTKQEYYPHLKDDESRAGEIPEPPLPELALDNFVRIGLNEKPIDPQEGSQE